jgi:hypothetical protein
VLVKIFNFILLKGSYPKAWSEGMIVPLYKKGSPLLTDNYRGITISSCLGKVFGIAMNTRLKLFCAKHSLIDDKQSSHRKGSRTSDNVFILRTLFEKYCGQNNSKLYISFIDFRKAFDSIWHDGLFVKLLRMGIGGPYYNVLKSMYKNITSSV